MLCYNLNSISHIFCYFYQLRILGNTKMNRIKEVLDAKGIKQTWLAEKLGKSFNMVNAYAQNRSQPSLEVLYKIAELLNVEAKELLVENKNVKSGK